MQAIRTFDELLERAAALPRKRILVVAPANTETLRAVAEALARLPVSPILVGDAQVIERELRAAGADPSAAGIEHRPDVRATLERAVEIARTGGADVLMKGSVDTGTLMRAVLQESAGLRTGGLLSDVLMAEMPAAPARRFLLITDGGLTLAPDLKEKADIIRNAVRVAHALGISLPKVAVLSASEFVLPTLPSSLDAAVLVRMQERGQITGCVVDGPLALDTAVSPEAAAEKGLRTPAAGAADILVAPGIEAGNILGKSVTYFAGYRVAHVIVGARLPILIPSRADRSDAKLLSIAAGMLMSEPRAEA
jgi:phosphate butyryltransferase